jgi:hypothetical protein
MTPIEEGRKLWADVGWNAIVNGLSGKAGGMSEGFFGDRVRDGFKILTQRLLDLSKAPNFTMADHKKLIDDLEGLGLLPTSCDKVVLEMTRGEAKDLGALLQSILRESNYWNCGTLKMAITAIDDALYRKASKV